MNTRLQTELQKGKLTLEVAISSDGSPEPGPGEGQEDFPVPFPGPTTAHLRASSDCLVFLTKITAQKPIFILVVIQMRQMKMKAHP